MNRREVIVSASAFPIVLAMPMSKAFARMPSGIVTWEPGALDNPHAHMVAGKLIEIAKDDTIYAGGDSFGFDWAIKFTDPSFVVRQEGKVFNWMTGYTDENGLAIDIYERGVLLGTTGIATNVGYDEYWSDSPPRDRAKMPDYFVRKLHIKYDRMQLIEAGLPKKHVDIDMRWIKQYSKQQKEA